MIDVIDQLTSAALLVSEKDAERFVPSNAGLYSIFIDHPENLPEPFRGYITRQNTTLVYIGQASTSLRKRLVDQDLRHLHPSTFFRGIGAVLEFRPPTGSLRGKSNQNNYKFSSQDTKMIVHWINTHLSLRWVILDAKILDTEEQLVINFLKPVMNTTYNPDRLSELSRLRDVCRQIARA